MSRPPSPSSSPEQPSPAPRAHSDPGVVGRTTFSTLRNPRTLPPLDIRSSAPARVRRIKLIKPSQLRWRRRGENHRLVRMEVKQARPRRPSHESLPDPELYEVTEVEFAREPTEGKASPLSPPARETTEVQTTTQAALRTLLRALCPGPEHRKLRRAILALFTLLAAAGGAALLGYGVAKS